MSSTRLGMVRCEHCGRQFNPHSGARHIPWCAKQQSENRKHKLSAEKRQALERYKWRIGYRPTNQIGNASISNNQHQQFKQKLQQRLNNNRLADLGEHLKKSSLNSSTTRSSPSASSANSTGTGSIISGSSGLENVHQRRLNGGHRLAGGIAPKQTQLGQLKRSISSLTLTKQVGVSSIDHYGARVNRTKSSGLPSSDEVGGRPQVNQTGQLRTKSVNDLLNAQHMGEIVETLTKRMDEIYAQNQRLLASLSNSTKSRNSKPRLSLSSKNLSPNSDSEDFGGQDSDNLVMCHHCKSNCIESANYCHKCGCKVRATTSSSSPD